MVFVVLALFMLALVVVFVVMSILVLALVVVFVVISILVLALVVVFVVMSILVLWHGQIVSTGIAVEFFAVFGVISQVVNIRCARPVQITAELVDEKRFIIKRFCAIRHGVCCRGKRSIAAKAV